jgi:hypothetical protein
MPVRELPPPFVTTTPAKPRSLRPKHSAMPWKAMNSWSSWCAPTQTWVARRSASGIGAPSGTKTSASSRENRMSHLSLGPRAAADVKIQDLTPRRPAGLSAKLAAAIAWPWRFAFSSGVRRRIRSARAGNSSFSTRAAVATITSPPSPEVTRPSTRTLSIV